jgi:LuxR family maltose regulon positive regulatory protein
MAELAAGTATSERDVLLATKLNVPRLRPDLVPRPRLAQRLGEARGQGLVLVCAPAGYGKTVLLAEWVRRSQRPAAWLSLDAGDNDPARFWRHALAALDRVRPGISEQVGSLPGSPASSSFEPLMTALINEVASWPDADGALLRQVAAPGGARPDASLTDAVAVALAARTEGWAAGLQLAGLPPRGHDDVDRFVAAFTGSHRYVLDYLAEEVLERQSVRLREFLLETSVLERLSAELCDAVTGRPGSQALLEQAERAGLFVVPLDEVRGWWRYHHLFADLLRAGRVQEAVDGGGVEVSGDPRIAGRRFRGPAPFLPAPAVPVPGAERRW